MMLNLLLVFSFALAAPADYQVCEKDTDCVPNSSCHPTMAINKKYRKEDKGVMCTMDCRTILDCGRGEIKCEKNKCVVKDITKLNLFVVFKLA